MQRSPLARHLLRPLLLSFALTFAALTALGMIQSLGGGTAFAQAPTPAPITLSDAAHDTTLLQRLGSLVGLVGLMGIAWLMSTDRRRISWRVVGIGTAIQLVFATLILVFPFGRPLFQAATEAFNRLLQFTNAGSSLLFGNNETFLATFVFGILPTVIFFSSLMSVLYHVGIMQRIVSVIALLMQRTMRTSGSETLSAAANIFVGQTEAPLMIKPFVADMTRSELMAVMTGGFATVAGGVMAAYIGFLSPYFPDIAGHLLAASVMSAPAALVIAKIMHPETEVSKTANAVQVEIERVDANVIDAAARGASEGMTLALNIAAMLLAFVALIALLNYCIALPSYIQHGSALNTLASAIHDAGIEWPEALAARCDSTVVRVPSEMRAPCIDELRATLFVDVAPPSVEVWSVMRLEVLFGVVFWPIALLMGVPVADCYTIAQLLGTKMVVNEFVAYLDLSQLLQNPEHGLHPRSITIATYALCGFANFSSIAIQIGGIGGIAPTRRRDLAQLGVRAMIGGSLAAFMTATIAGMLL
jgi:CNT family concentrative nucleoside transporter